MEQNRDRVSFRPHATLDVLKYRARLLREVRNIFDRAGFTEVQTPVLSRDSVIDRFVEPLSVEVELPGAGMERYYLQTSPEFAMKRLLAAGLDALYQITPVFRRYDRGPVHNIEFTMLEWYRAGHSYRDGIEFLARWIDELFHVMGRRSTPCEIVSLEDILFERTGLSFASGPDDYRRYALESSLKFPESFLSHDRPATQDDWFDFVFAESIQPGLGATGPTILFDYPVWQPQLAQIRPDTESGPFESRYGASTTSRAERFELFDSGLELANGYHELLDASILQERNEATQQRRMADGKAFLPTSGKLLAAMESGLPPSCGCALGIDRLLMVLCETDRIDDVLAFPIEDA